MKFKKIVSWLLAVSLAVGAVGLPAVEGGVSFISEITASAEAEGSTSVRTETVRSSAWGTATRDSETTEDSEKEKKQNYSDYEYTVLGNGTIEITGYSGDDTTVTIPSKINGKTVTSIGEYVFYQKTDVTSAVIPNTVTNISNDAFDDCTSLKRITIPSSVTSMGDSPFFGCTSLTNISVDKNNKNYISVDGVLYNKDKTVLIVYPDGKTGTSYSIPSSVKTIGNHAFSEAENLTSITIPNSVKSIGLNAFANTSLKSVTIPNGVTRIESATFFNCSALTSVTIPDTVTSIDDSVFVNCSSLKSVTIPDGVTIINEWVFYGCSSLTNVALPSNLKTIDSKAFYGCKSLESIIIPNGVETICCAAFNSCSSLTCVTIPDSVISIEKEAFFNCTSLKTITIPKSVTKIGYGDSVHVVLGDKVFGFWDSAKQAISYDNFKINCYLGSAAEKYAKENGISYKLLDHTHSYKSKVVKPTTSAKGYTLKTCSSCGDEIKSNYTAKLIAMSKCKASISKSSYTYTGKAIKPTVTVKYGSKKLTKGTDYTVSYKNNTKTGKATITIKGKGKYSGTITKTFNIVPKKATLSSVKSPKTKTLKVTWKKDSQATGYQIVYSTSSKFKSSKSVNISKNSTTSKTISKLTKGKTYYVKVRSYKTIGGKKVYGAYSTVKKIKCK